MTSPLHPVAQGDPAILLRRINRHVPFDVDRVVLALVRLSRTYVERAAWLDSSEPEPRLPGAEADLRARVHAAFLRVWPAGPAIRGGRPAHAVAMVRCRRGRVVWLPSNDVWLDALADETARRGLPVGEAFLVTEHGWRAYAGTAGSTPAVAA